MNEADRLIGLEQEFFLVDQAGVPCDRSDEFLQRCQELAEVETQNSNCFAPEWVKGIVEINTPPAHTIKELANAYLSNLKLALRVGQELGLRLYPLSTYPLHVMPIIRNRPWYQVQIRTVGYERFLHAGRCTGMHFHLDLPEGTISPRIGVSFDTTVEAQAELLNIYNLATALDTGLVALSRACPFYEGQALGVAAHTVHYRGSETFGWDGVYAKLPQVGALQPYAGNVEELVEQQFTRYYAWLEAMDRADVDRHLFQEAGGGLLKAAWNRVRLNKIGTVEMRGTDSNYPEVILAIATLIHNAAERVRREKLTVRPAEGARTFELNGDQLSVPEFKYLNGDLLYAAVTEGVKHPEVAAYLESILKFVLTEASEGSEYLAKLTLPIRDYQTTEAEILRKYTPVTAQLSQDEGLLLVREACDKLEEQVLSLSD